jgi:hypothetical protein
VVSTAVLGGAATSHGQEGQPGALKIANGNGVTGTPGWDLRTFSFSLVELPDGSLQGHGVLHDQMSMGLLHFDITSYTVVDDILLMAGPITLVNENVPPVFFVGATFFFAVRDDGQGNLAIDEISGAMAVPFPGWTIEEILDFICDNTPGCDPDEPIVIPPDVLRPTTAGDIKVFYENL